jgi:hypothetical protein
MNDHRVCPTEAQFSLMKNKNKGLLKIRGGDAVTNEIGVAFDNPIRAPVGAF